MNVIPSSYPNNIRAKYMVQSGVHTLLNATGHTGASGFWYLYNPLASGKRVYVKRVVLRAATTTALITLTAPRIGVTRFSYTGTITATAIAPAKMESSEATPTALPVTGGMGTAVMTAGATCTSFIIGGAMTAVGAGMIAEQQYNALTGEELILVEGEGLSFNQMDASTGSDTRVCCFTVVWEEDV
jgi:hypothetical protein